MSQFRDFSKERLQRFYGKSQFMVPHCFGGYDSGDVVCQRWCARATERDLLNLSYEIREDLDELGPDTFFSNASDFQISCQQRREELEKAGNKGEMKRLKKEKKIRDKYYLGRGSIKCENCLKIRGNLVGLISS